MAGMVPKYQRDGTWVYLPIRVALEMVGLEDTGVYIARRQNMAAQYIAARPIMELCLEVDQKPECAYPGDGERIPPCISWG